MSGPVVADARISARRLASGATWVYGGQLLAAIAQFGYAAVTSRLVGPAEFGVYAITLAISSLVTLIATGGLGQTVGRMNALDRRTIRALCSLALLLGLVSAAVLGLAAPLWARLWSTPSAAPAVAVMSVAAFTAPLTGLMTGLVRRLGHFRLLAVQQLAGTLIGMAVGVLAVLRFQSSESLLVSVIVSQLLIGAFGAWTARAYVGLGGLKAAVHELGFSVRLTIASLLSYGVGNITRIVATAVLGSSAIGYWNRAEVVSIIPFQQLQTALIQTIYPEFRHDRDSAERARRTWTDLLVIMGWGMMLIAAVGAVAVPPLVLILLGPQWEPARVLVPVLMFAGAVQAVGTLLAAAIEAIGRFRWVWATQAVLLGLQVLIALSTVWTRSLFLTVLGLLVTGVVRQVFQVIVCARGGYLDGARLARSALWTALITVGAWAILTLLLQIVGPTLLSTAAVLVVLLVSAVLLRRPLLRTPVMRLVAQYGLLPGVRR